MKHITTQSIKQTLASNSDLKKYQKSQEYETLGDALRTNLSEAVKNGWYAVIFKGKRPLDGGLAPWGFDISSFLNDNGDLKSGINIKYYETEEDFEEAYFK